MYDCLGSTLIKDISSRLTPGGAGQRHVYGEREAIKAARAIAGGEATAFMTYVKGKSPSPKVRGAAMRKAFGLNTGGAKLALARYAGTTIVDTDTAARMMVAVFHSPALASPTGKFKGYTLQGPNAAPPGIPDKSPKYRAWYDRAYGRPQVPGLGFDFGSILSAVPGGSGGLISAFLPKPKDPAAEAAKAAAQAQASAANKQLKLAQLQADQSDKTRNLLLIGGGVAVAGLIAWMVLRKKS